MGPARPVLILAAALGSALFATPRLASQVQQQSQEELQKLRAEKLQKPVFQKAAWVKSYDQALELARKEDKPIFAFFTRSYAHCSPCENLENEVLAGSDFAEFGKSVVLFVHVTSNVAGEKHGNLHREKGFRTFPALAFLDADGTVLAVQRDLTVAGFASTAAKVEALLAARKAAAGGGGEADKSLLLAELELDRLDSAQITARARKLDLSKEEALRIDRKLVDNELAELQRQVRVLGREEVLRRFGELVRSGRRPNEQNAMQFWNMSLAFAAQAKDPQLAEQSFAELTSRAGKQERFKPAVENWEKLLAESKQKQ
jgi:hypothetical protein